MKSTRRKDRGRGRPKLPGDWFAFSIVSLTVGIGIAALLVPGFAVPGVVGLEHLPVLLVVASGFAAAITVLMWSIARILILVGYRNLARMVDEDDFGTFDQGLYEPFRSHMYLIAAGLLVQPIMAVLIAPAVLALWVELLKLLGLPVELDGLRATVATALVGLGVGKVLAQLLQLVLRWRGPRGDAIRGLVQYGLCLGGLWIVDLLLGAVSLQSGLGWLHLLSMAALAAVFNYSVGWLQLSLPVPGAASVILIIANVLRLDVIRWISAGMVLPLVVDGNGGFALAVLIITVAIAPARAAARRAWFRQEPAIPPDAPFFPDISGGYRRSHAHHACCSPLSLDAPP